MVFGLEKLRKSSRDERDEMNASAGHDGDKTFEDDKGLKSKMNHWGRRRSSGGKMNEDEGNKTNSEMNRGDDDGGLKRMNAGMNEDDGGMSRMNRINRRMNEEEDGMNSGMNSGMHQDSQKGNRFGS